MGSRGRCSEPAWCGLAQLGLDVGGTPRPRRWHLDSVLSQGATQPWEAAVELASRPPPHLHTGFLYCHPLQLLYCPSRVFIWEETRYHWPTVFPATAGAGEPRKASEQRRNWMRGHPYESWCALGFLGSVSSLRAKMSQALEPCSPEVSALGQRPVGRATGGTCVTKAGDLGWSPRCARVQGGSLDLQEPVPREVEEGGGGGVRVL